MCCVQLVCRTQLVCHLLGIPLPLAFSGLSPRTHASPSLGRYSGAYMSVLGADPHPWEFRPHVLVPPSLDL